MSIRSFNIVFQGVEYCVDVAREGKNTTVYIEYADIDEDVEQDTILKLTDYLINEGFVEYKK